MFSLRKHPFHLALRSTVAKSEEKRMLSQASECFARESAMLKLEKRGENRLLFLLSLIFLCHNIKDDGYNSTKITKQL